MEETNLDRLKEQFREFCALLTVTEITSNAPLMTVIERFDRMLRAASPTN